MGDPAPTERHMPVGYRFHPTDQELVGHYLHRKLTTDDPSIHDTVPEIGFCKYEPRDLLARAASEASATKFDDFQCYFFSPRDYKYSNGKQLNRTTSRGFWKVTGRDRRIIDRDTNNVIGIKKTLVFYEGRVPHALKTCWIIHEFHDAQLPPQQEHGSLYTESMIQPSSQLNEATNSMIQPPSQLIEATDSMIQPSSHEATDSMIQPPFKLTEATDSMIQPSFLEATDSMIQLPFKLTKATDSMIQPSFHEATDSMIHLPFKLSEATNLIIQSPSQLNEAKDSTVQPTFQADEAMNSVIHAPPESNSASEALLDAGEFYLSPGEVDIVSLWQLPPAPSMDL